MCALSPTVGTWHLSDDTPENSGWSALLMLSPREGQVEEWDMGETLWLDAGHCQDSHFYLEGSVQ